jgi:hypothetical protein
MQSISTTIFFSLGIFRGGQVLAGDSMLCNLGIETGTHVQQPLDGASHEGRDTGTAAILHNFPVVF